MERRKIFFIVDDDSDDVGLFMEAVNKVDPTIECFSAPDGHEALRKLDAAQEIPDIIFLDLNMPRMNGKQCLAEIKKNEKLSRTSVIVYTTSSYHKDIEDTRNLGASYFFTKPASFKELCNILTRIASGENSAALAT